jgi:hypothetical protein
MRGSFLIRPNPSDFSMISPPSAANPMLSNTKKRLIGVKFAKTYNLDYKEIYKFIQSIKIHSEFQCWTELNRHYFGRKE